jgi:hypothetical protein
VQSPEFRNAESPKKNKNKRKQKQKTPQDFLCYTEKKKTFAIYVVSDIMFMCKQIYFIEGGSFQRHLH